MPRMPDSFLDSVVFIFETEEDAQRGENVCGSGVVVVGVPAAIPQKPLKTPWHHLYIVTSDHILKALHSPPVIRFNTRSGGIRVDIAPLHEWERDTAWDVAAVHLRGAMSDMTIDACWMSTAELMLSEEMSRHPMRDVGVGDDVICIGSLQYEGMVPYARNNPFVIDGMISRMPRQGDYDAAMNKQLDSIAVDMRGRRGLSGSPVFVYRTPLTNIKLQVDETMPPITKRILDTQGWVHCLGIVVSGVESQAMTWTMPSWHIISLLTNSETFKERRRDDEQSFMDAI